MTSYPRRKFLKYGFLTSLGLAATSQLRASSIPSIQLPPLLPGRLRKGDSIAICSPAGAVFDQDAPAEFRYILESMGFEVVLADSLFRKHGYFSGTDKERADELIALFSNPSIKGIIAMRGGWGCARILPLLDYEMIRRNPKVFMGFSDISALLVAIRMHSGLLTFHGPVGYSTWSPAIIDEFNTNLVHPGSQRIIPADKGFRTLRQGTGTGELIGGNLKVITSLIGSPYFPKSLEGRILFVEETGEEVYRIDRMLTQLRLAGLLEGLEGFIFGACRKCNPEFPERSFSLDQMLDDFATFLNCPAFTGARIGHVSDQYILPVGATARINAGLGTIIVSQQAVN